MNSLYKIASRGMILDKIDRGAWWDAIRCMDQSGSIWALPIVQMRVYLAKRGADDKFWGMWPTRKNV
jgi:hypothetical protein